MLIQEYFYKHPELFLFVAGAMGSVVLVTTQTVSEINSVNLPVALLLYLAIAVVAGKPVRSLYQSAYSDALTDVWNRRYFELRLSEEAQRLTRTKSSLCIAFIDSDSFKYVNDAYGHSTGDELLRKIAVAIKQNTRHFDIPCRWGGDEFAIIFPDTKIDGALAVAERIRKAVDGSKACFYSTTLSIGIIQVHAETDVASVLKAADQALYKAKEVRNTVYIGTHSQENVCG